MARKSLKVLRTRVQMAPDSAVEDYASQASSKMLKCRTRGHRWDEYDVEGDSKHGYVVHYRCALCKAMREQELDADGYIIDNTYKYPDGYQMPPGTGRLSRDGNAILRLNVVQQSVHRLSVRAQRQAS